MLTGMFAPSVGVPVFDVHVTVALIAGVPVAVPPVIVPTAGWLIVMVYLLEAYVGVPTIVVPVSKPADPLRAHPAPGADDPEHTMVELYPVAVRLLMLIVFELDPETNAALGRMRTRVELYLSMLSTVVPAGTNPETVEASVIPGIKLEELSHSIRVLAGQ